MDSYHISEIVAALVKGKVITEKNRHHAEKKLQAAFEDKIIVVWCIDDVIGRAKERGIKLSRKKALEALEGMERRHDASMGINWDTVDCWIDEVR
jgi:hypothetical protein